MEMTVACLTVTRHFAILTEMPNFDKKHAMNSADNLRNSIIDKLLTISNKDYLAALYQLVEKSTAGSDVVKLSEEQMLMLEMSDKDIENGKLISQDQLDKKDLQSIKEL